MVWEVFWGHFGPMGRSFTALKGLFRVFLGVFWISRPRKSVPEHLHDQTTAEETQDFGVPKIVKKAKIFDFFEMF